jgi:ParB-like chromosome segregation protein Spo0J
MKEIVLKNINEIKPYWRNPRNNERTITSLIESIKKFGFKVPIVVDKDFVIITGHSRHTAALQLKGQLDEEIKELRDLSEKTKDTESKIRLNIKIANMKQLNYGKVPIIIADELTEKEAKEFRIADNKIHDLTFWDTDKLKLEVRELQDVIGFDENEIKNLIKDVDVNYDSYTSDEISDVENKINTQFEERIDNFNDDKVRLCCPYCNKEYLLSKDEILTSKYLKKNQY